MKMIKLISLFILFWSNSLFFAQSQNYIPITRDNVYELEPILRLDIGDSDIAFSPDGNILAIVDAVLVDDGDNYTNVHLIDIPTQEFFDLVHISGFQVTHISFHSHDPTLALGSLDGRIAIWSLETRSLVNIWQAENTPIIELLFHPSLDILYSGSGYAYGRPIEPQGDERLAVWDFKSGTELAFAQPTAGHVHSIEFDENTSSLLVGIFNDIYIYELCDKCTDYNFSFLARVSVISDMYMMPESEKIISVGGSFIRSWDLESYFEGDRLISIAVNVNLPNVPFGLLSVDVIPESSLIITGDSEGILTIWDETNWERLVELKEFQIGVHDLAISPNYDMIASVSPHEGTILWGIPSSQ